MSSKGSGVARTYLPRVADGELAARMSSAGAVLIEGPKACGKTATATQVASSVVRLDIDAGARALVGAAPEVLFDQRTPILFDEWQIEPTLWDLVRREVDDRSPRRGRFILTGSATPNDDTRRHSGAGRISTLRMRPMSLYEAGHSTGSVSLADLFAGGTPAALDPGVSVPELVDRIVIGGWPDLVDASVTDAQQWLRDYLRNVVEIDVQNLGARRDPRSVRALLTALGRGVGTEMTALSLAKDVGGADGPVARNTVAAYLRTLDRLMLVEDVPAWAPHMRSSTPLRKSPTRYLVDPSLGAAALGIGPRQLLADLHASRFHFEALTVRDLRVYAQPLGGSLSHWRDNNGHEVDVIVMLDDGRWAACEVKMNPGDVDDAAKSLLRFLQKVDTSKVGAPAFSAVITTRSSAYRRPDGVLVVPIASLRP
jgi:predicted AAA+ superfamily ATPase